MPRNEMLTKKKASTALGNIKYASRGLRRENDEDKRRALREEKVPSSCQRQEQSPPKAARG